jgi:hypothetical protein
MFDRGAPEDATSSKIIEEIERILGMPLSGFESVYDELWIAAATSKGVSPDELLERASIVAEADSKAAVQVVLGRERKLFEQEVCGVISKIDKRQESRLVQIRDTMMHAYAQEVNQRRVEDKWGHLLDMFDDTF